MAPLVDVVLLLLMFLLVSARFDRAHVLEVDLPRVSAADASAPPAAERRVVTLAADGSIAWNGREVTREELAALVSATPAADRLLPIVIQGDRSASLGDGLALLDLLRGLGCPHCVFRVHAEPPAEPKGR
jgi:biopolymer transport protein ExbD